MMKKLFSTNPNLTNTELTTNPKDLFKQWLFNFKIFQRMRDYSSITTDGKIDLKNAGSKKEKSKTRFIVFLIIIIFISLISASFYFGDS